MRKSKLAAAVMAAALVGTYMTRDGEKPLPDFNAKGDLQRVMEVRSFDVDARTVELAFSSEFEGERWFGIEILDHAPESIRLDRLRDGGALLVDHDWSDQVGVVESVTIGADRRGRAVVRFGRSARANEIFQDVVDGIRKHVSVGYRVHGAKLVETRDDTDVYRITDWEPLEISLVSVPFDHTVGVGRSLEKAQEEPKAAPTQTASVESGAATEQPKSEEFRNMKIIVTRDAAGNLVRAEVDEQGNIAKVLEVLEKAGEDVRSHQRSGTDAERKRTASILEMGEKYQCGDLARDFVKEGKSPEDFARAALEHINKRGSRPLNEQSADSNIGLTDKEVRSYSFLNVVRALVNPTDKRAQEAAAFEFEASRAAAEKADKEPQGILVPTDVLSRALNTSTAGGAAGNTGGYAIATDLQTQSFVEMLRNRNTIMQRGRVLAGLVGNLDIPRQIAGAQGYWLGEDEAAGEGAPDLDQISLTPKTVGAFTEITRKFLQQSSLDAEGLVRSDLASALATTIDLAGYYGSGTANQPRGIANYTGINAVDFAAVNPTYAELVQMETEVAADNADVNSMAYVLNARMRGAMKTAQKFAGTNGATIWEPGNTLNGYGTEVTNQVANGDIFMGNFADLIIGLWGGLDLTVDPYSNSTKGKLRIVVFQDVDFVLRRLQSFCLGRMVP